MPIWLKQAMTAPSKLRYVQRLRDSAKSNQVLLVNIATTVGVSATGDMLQQYSAYFTDRLKWDGRRTGHMATSGLTLGVASHVFYRWLDGALPARTPAVIAAKVLVDQAFSPVLLALFLATLAVLERVSWRQFVREAADKGPRLLAAELAVWPVAQTLNFRYVAPRYRLVYVNCVSLGLDVYSSGVKYGDTQTDGVAGPNRRAQKGSK